jgi:hypothetical protein
LAHSKCQMLLQTRAPPPPPSTWASNHSPPFRHWLPRLPRTARLSRSSSPTLASSPLRKRTPTNWLTQCTICLFSHQISRIKKRISLRQAKSYQSITYSPRCHPRLQVALALPQPKVLSLSRTEWCPLPRITARSWCKILSQPRITRLSCRLRSTMLPQVQIQTNNLLPLRWW